MFRNGQFGQKNVFMKDLLSSPVNIEAVDPVPQNTQMPQLDMPDYDVPEPFEIDPDRVGELGGKISGLVGSLFEGKKAPDGKTPAGEHLEEPDGGVDRAAYDRMMMTDISKGPDGTSPAGRYMATPRTGVNRSAYDNLMLGDIYGNKAY